MYKKLYFYTCIECDEPRQTLRPEAFRKGVCQKCRRNVVNENQLSIFTSLESVNNPVEDGDKSI